MSLPAASWWQKPACECKTKNYPSTMLRLLKHPAQQPTPTPPILSSISTKSILSTPLLAEQVLPTTTFTSGLTCNSSASTLKFQPFGERIRRGVLSKRVRENGNESMYVGERLPSSASLFLSCWPSPDTRRDGVRRGARELRAEGWMADGIVLVSASTLFLV